MCDIALCAKSFQSLLNIEYEFVIAKKGEKKSLKIIFNKRHFYHLAGLHYLFENSSDNPKIFAFIDKNPDGNYFCRSFFPQEKYDYSKGQIKWTLLLKKKILKVTGKEIILYKKQ